MTAGITSNLLEWVIPRNPYYASQVHSSSCNWPATCYGFMQEPQPHSNFHCYCLVNPYYGDGLMQQGPHFIAVASATKIGVGDESVMSDFCRPIWSPESKVG